MTVVDVISENETVRKSTNVKHRMVIDMKDSSWTVTSPTTEKILQSTLVKTATVQGFQLSTAVVWNKWDWSRSTYLADSQLLCVLNMMCGWYYKSCQCVDNCRIPVTRQRLVPPPWNKGQTTWTCTTTSYQTRAAKDLLTTSLSDQWQVYMLSHVPYILAYKSLPRISCPPP